MLRLRENSLTKHIQHFVSLLKSVSGVNIQAKGNAVDVILTVFPKGILLSSHQRLKLNLGGWRS